MEFEWDEAKNRVNIQTRGIDFASARDFDFSSAQTKRDARLEYGEDRSVAVGYIGRRLHVLVYTLRGARIRVISLRKANSRERRSYASESGKSGGDAG
ncbi:BrnT family toxin [Rhodobacterales bacterium HKCCE2091]|nr:BrnT family toxin [Rhodobacterales bacterium HKCCE2091]